MPTRTIQVPKVLYRSGVSEAKEDGTIRLSISSNEPYRRYDWRADEDYFEVLDHESGGMDDSRLKAGAALLFNHKRDVQLGTINAPEMVNGKCYVTAKLSDAEDVKSYRTRIAEKILKDTSVGYGIADEGECIGAKDGIPIYKFKWFPHEASMVTIPADTTVGLGRDTADRGQEEKPELTEIRVSEENSLAKDKETDETQKRHQPPKTMPAEIAPEVTPKIDVVKERADAIEGAFKTHNEKCDKIDAWVKQLPKEPWRVTAGEVADGFKKLGDKRSFDEFRTVALDACEKAVALDTPQENATLGMGRKDIGRFSLVKAMFEVAMQKRGQGKGLSGHEKAVCEAASKLYGNADQREFTGLCIPDDITTSSFAETKDLNSQSLRNLGEEVQMLRRTLNATVFTAGGALVSVDLLAGSMIDILRNAVLVGNGPMSITELGGLVGNIAIPKQTGTSTVYWLAEGAAITQSQQTFAQLNLSPRRIGVATQYTKQLLAQSSIGVEAFVRQDQMLTQAVEEDRVAFLGSGVNGEPTGIFNTTGVLANVTFSGAATWADMIALEYGLENANIRTGQMTIATSPLTKSYLKQTVVVAASTFPIFIWGKNEGWPTINGVMPGVINDYPAYATKNITTNVMVQGVFKNFIKARWAGFDVVVDPYTGALSETINIICNSWLDQALRYPQSFNVTTDAPTAP